MDWEWRNDYISQDLLSNVRIITDFLKKPLSDDLADLIAEQWTFKGMMKSVQSYLLRGKEDDPKLLQKGVVGNWKEHFTPELNERFEKEVMAKLKGSGLELDFELWHITRMFPCGTPDMTGAQSDWQIGSPRLQHVIDLGENWIDRKVKSR